MKPEDTLHRDAELEANAAEAQAICATTAAGIARRLTEMGFELVVVRVAKMVRGKGGECALPGATAAAASPAIAPCLMLEAAELRSVAEKFEAEFRKSGVREAHEGYAEDATHRAAEYER